MALYDFKILIIGMGSIGQKHLHVLESLGCDVDSYDPYSDLSTYSDINNIEFNDYDAFVIASCSGTHIEWVNKIDIYNKPIFIEKPIFSDLVEYESARSIKHPENVFNASNLYFEKSIQVLIDLIKKGDLGEIYSANFYFRHNINLQRSSGGAYAKSKEYGGCFMDVGPHEYLLCNKLFGPYQDHSCNVDKSSESIFEDEIVSIQLKKDDAPFVSIELDLLSNVRMRGGRVIGTKGVFEWSEVGKPIRRECWLHKNNEKSIRFETDDNAFMRQAKHFCLFIKGEVKPIYGFNFTASSTLDLLGMREG